MAKKTLNDDEISLFHEETRNTEPLKQERIEPFRKRHAPVPRPRPLEADDQELLAIAEQQIETGEELLFARPGIQQRLLADLKRGRLEIGFELDLHGLTVNHAHGELEAFLRECHRRTIRCVRIIHGKGCGSENRQPVLKQKLNYWLQQRKDVLAFCSAPRWDGGTGAAYVLLRNPRKSRDQR